MPDTQTALHTLIALRKGYLEENEKDEKEFHALEQAYLGRTNSRRVAIDALDNLIELEKKRFSDVLTSAPLTGPFDTGEPTTVATSAPELLLAHSYSRHPRAGTRAPRNQVYKHVREILSNGQPMGATAIRFAIVSKFRVTYGASSIYRALTKGQEDGLYKSDGGAWSITLQGAAIHQGL